MRRRMSDYVFYGLWIITALGFTAVYWIISVQETVAADLTAKLEAVERAIIAGDWSDAAEIVGDVYETWRRIERKWALHTQHEELEAITDVLLDAHTMIYLQDVQAVVALRLARDRLLTLPQRDRVLLENLL